MDDLVTPAWLDAELGARDLRVIDASYDAFGDPAAARAGFAAGHIPGARFLDLATLADPGSPLPGMRPAPAAFAARMAALGIGDGDRVILYDDNPHRTSARAWWLLRSYGFERVALLDGGLARWRGEGRALATGEAAPGDAAFTPRDRPALVAGLDRVRAVLADGSAQIVDARGAGRFAGSEPDPRPGVAPGHIPGSRNLPYHALLRPDGTWKRGAELRAAFEEAGVDPGRPLLLSCGSGVTAAVVMFGAHLLGNRDLSLYDGSWSEWGARADTPKATA